MTSLLAHAKINLALVVGPTRADGLHEVATVMQRIDLADTIHLEPAETLTVEGFGEDTLVRLALEAVAGAAGVAPLWRARIEKRIPVAAGLGGGSSDAAAALRLANATLPEPLPASGLHRLARRLGADVAFFLTDGPQLATGEGAALEPLRLPQDYSVLLLLPTGAVKESTGAVYARYSGAEGFESRRAAVDSVARSAAVPADLGQFPGNDLAHSPLAAHLSARGAFRADVSGAGPTVYGLFADREAAERAAAAVGALGDTWIVRPAW
ncbi:MAG: 4-(cytidine 5'-diphospho)-2-C-methyl-D-erythritol kinase [Actinomycetes bacterium]